MIGAFKSGSEIERVYRQREREIKRNRHGQQAFFIEISLKLVKESENLYILVESKYGEDESASGKEHSSGRTVSVSCT